MGMGGKQNDDKIAPPRHQQYPAWARSVDETLLHHKTSLSKGLDSDEAARRLEEWGPNELHEEPKKPLWKLVLEQFDDTLVKVLLLAAAVSFVLVFYEEKQETDGLNIYDFIEPGVILLILILNAIVGVVQEQNAENALEALKSMVSETAKVLRDGKWINELEASDLVPGDIVELRVGDKAPADIRVLQLKTATLKMVQASMTGESEAVMKDVGNGTDEGIELQLKTNMLFSGTGVVGGTCVGVVNDTGMATEIGKIMAQIEEAGEEVDDTPLKQKLNRFGETLTWLIGIVCLLVWVMNYREFLTITLFPFSIDFSLIKCTFYFKVAVALAVAAIPEGLPAVITTCLALGTRKMAKQNAITKNLPSVETLGCTTVICSDKTGTLTTNQMSAIRVVTMGSSTGALRDFSVSGTTYDPNDGSVENLPVNLDASLQAIAKVCTHCNESDIEKVEGTFRAVGAPTEAALRVLVEKLGIPASVSSVSSEDDILQAKTWYGKGVSTVSVLEFDRFRKSMSVLCSTEASGNAPAAQTTRSPLRLRSLRADKNAAPERENMLLAKGAPERIIERCSTAMLEDGKVVTLTSSMKKLLMDKMTAMSGDALRVLALAVKDSKTLGPLATCDGPSHPGWKSLMDHSQYETIESDMTIIGMVGLLDPPRPEVRTSLQECRDAGIRVMMITGDSKLTADAIARDIGILEGDAEGKSFIGRDFDALSHEDKLAILGGSGGRVFSRAEPKHKQDIIKLLKEMQEVTAMTGDGVNDAPALKLADIGVAMGITGTGVAKEASDMILKDDNFATIVSAVKEGRSIYNNMKAFIRYMISSNIGEVASLFISAILGLPEGLIPVQLLWVNLVTDGPPATALGFNPADPDIMKHKPRGLKDSLINGWVLFRYIIVGIYVGMATVGIFAVWYTCDSFLGVDLSGDNHTTVSYHNLSHWSSCNDGAFSGGSFLAGDTLHSFEGCEYFTKGSIKAKTLSLTVLVTIEMLNALNALSEDTSLLVVPPWANPWLLVAMLLSFSLHFFILYVPFYANIFSIVPLSLNEWWLVLIFSVPVLLLEEILKVVGKVRFARSKLKED